MIVIEEASNARQKTLIIYMYNINPKNKEMIKNAYWLNI
jgi:hypothetical protein